MEDVHSAEILLEHGADLNGCTSDHASPLLVSLCLSGQNQMSTLLINKGATILCKHNMYIYFSPLFLIKIVFQLISY